MSTDAINVVQVALPVPLRRFFDYQHTSRLVLGVRVKVPFNKRHLIGIVISNSPAKTTRPLKNIIEVLDTEHVFGKNLLNLLSWASHYYHHPPGDAIHAALPKILRAGQPLADPTRREFMRARNAETSHQMLMRAPLQAQIYACLCETEWVDAAVVRKKFAHCNDALRRLQQKNLLETEVRPMLYPAFHAGTDNQVKLNFEQQQAVDVLSKQAGHFSSFLLQGITGSGKTEVYLETAKHYIALGTQVLILVPEIALTPQLVALIKKRLGDAVCVLHSSLSAKARYHAWWLARAGHVGAVLGTRSAIFTPLKSLGLIVVDEEHDISYKQQEGFRYHARDLALKRARLENIPVVLGSATPSMETRYNARPGHRHQLLRLNQRAGIAELPRIDFIDLKQHRAVDGISMPLLKALKERFAKREQSIVFLNRRGFAPVAQCHQCRWQAECSQCDARLTYHRTREQFQCHYCGYTRPAETACPTCGGRLFFAGTGTQKLEQLLHVKIPKARICRLDRDQITTQLMLEREFESIQRGDIDIIIGTQLIAKGHNFPGVTLVAVVDSDQRLYSIDFRAPEYLFQQLTQVAGRAGRATAPGEVLIQTMHPQNDILQYIHRQDFERFADYCLTERREANYPPFSHLVLWRAESTDQAAALNFLHHTAHVGKRILADSQLTKIQIMDAVISPMQKLAGRYRAQLMVRSPERGPLHRLLSAWVEAIENDSKSRHTRWSIDVDPMEMF